MNILLGGILLTMIWGLVPVLQKKLLVKQLNPVSLMFISGTIYYILLLIYGLYHKDVIVSDMEKINGNIKIFLFILILNFFGVVVYYSLLEKYSSSSVSVITSIWPVFNIIFAYFLLNENISKELIALLSTILIVNIYLFQNGLSEN
jgi:drug/metabolite transporter (DMT)-like permease